VNLGRLLAAVRQRLERRGVADASLEAEIMARHVLDMDRAGLHAQPERPVSPREEAAVEALAERRARGEPSSYITGHRWFYGLDFLVAAGVLVPRPETELLVDVAVGVINGSGSDYRTAADIGTGSGVIAVCLAHLVPNLAVIATDISEQALDIARSNAGRHGVAERVTLCQGDLLEPLVEPVDIICANLPYVKRGDLPPGGPLSYEPRLALDGGPDGLDVLRRFVPQVAPKLRPGGCLVVEVGAGQAKKVLAILERELPPGGFNVHRDLAGHERVIEYRLTG
jgi:release factor glutamine methyltransferase